MAVIKITSLQSLMGAIQFAYKKFREDFCWWRGEGRICDDWKLSPKIYRKRLNEPELAFQFINRANVRHAQYPAANDSWPAWLFLMQHYNYPTRLLDWTESALIGLYFAVCQENYHAEKGNLWCLQPYKLNLHYDVNGVALPQLDPASSLCREAFLPKRNPTQKLLAVIGDHFDVRHLVQSAAFTIHGVRTTPLDDYPSRQSFLTNFEIPADAKPSLLADLKSLGIRESYLFPDLEHLASDVASWDA